MYCSMVKGIHMVSGWRQQSKSNVKVQSIQCDHVRMKIFLRVCFLAGLSARCVWSLTLLSSNQLVFVNVDHAPMGACSTMAYGYHGEPCGIGWSSGVYPYWSTWDGGVLLGMSNSAGLQLMPFVTNVIAGRSFFPD